MNILEEANKIVNGNRQDDYGHPIDNYEHLTSTCGQCQFMVLAPFHQVCIFSFENRIIPDPNKSCIVKSFAKISVASFGDPTCLVHRFT